MLIPACIFMFCLPTYRFLNHVANPVEPLCPCSVVVFVNSLRINVNIEHVCFYLAFISIYWCWNIDYCFIFVYVETLEYCAIFEYLLHVHSCRKKGIHMDTTYAYQMLHFFRLSCQRSPAVWVFNPLIVMQTVKFNFSVSIIIIW